MLPTVRAHHHHGEQAKTPAASFLHLCGPGLTSKNVLKNKPKMLEKASFGSFEKLRH
jgi:hypothetical protein